jgi:ferritin-like metal-binding protein YciE
MDEPPSATSLYPNEYPVSAIVAPRRVISKREAEVPPEPNAFEPVPCCSHCNCEGAPMPNQKNLKDLFSETLKDIYFAEKQILRALPKMAKEASSPELKQAFETHREQTEGHVERLNEVFEQIGRPARGKTCEAILGIIDEAKEIMEDFKGAEALDAGLASSGQAVEHYEIARYGTLKTWAQELGFNDAAKLLDQTLQEEIKADQLLTKIATSTVNMKAA